MEWMRIKAVNRIVKEGFEMTTNKKFSRRNFFKIAGAGGYCTGCAQLCESAVETFSDSHQG